MGIKEWFTELLPSLSPKSAKKSEAWPSASIPSDLVIVDLSGIAFHLPASAEPFQWSKTLISALPPIYAGTTLFLCSDNSEVKLPHKQVTRSMRPKSESYPEADHIARFLPLCAELEDGTQVVPEVGEEWLPAKFVGNRKSRAALFRFLVDEVKGTEFQSPDVIIEECVNNQACNAEADITIVNRIALLLGTMNQGTESKSPSQSAETKPKRRVLIRTDDSDVTALLLLRFASELCQGSLEVIQSRGSKYGYIDVNQAARDIFTEHRLTRHDLLALCMAAGNDYVDKQWCTPNVGHKHLVPRLLESLDVISIADIDSEWTLERVARWFQTVAGGRADIIAPLDKAISLKEDSSNLTKERTRTRLAAEQGIVPWEYMKWLRDYWFTQSMQVFTTSSSSSVIEEGDTAMQSVAE